MKYKWIINNTKTKKFIDEEHIHPIANTILSQMKFSSVVDAKKFLLGKKNTFHSYKHFYDINKIVNFLSKSIQEGKKIFIHGDYDVDGIVATSILWDFLYRKLKANVLPIVPNRFEDGYGLSPSTIDKIIRQEGEIIITVDCGIKDIELIKKYPKISFIITDHHTFLCDETGKKIRPESDNLIGIIHPQDPESSYPFKEISGATVAWKLICALNEELDLNVDVNDYLELVALATSTDIMPLVDENRSILKEGLKRIRKTHNPSLIALFEVSGIDSKVIETYHYGYVIGPRLNAAGRMDDAIDAVRLLSTNNKKQASIYAKKLNELNLVRQQKTIELLNVSEEIISKISKNQKLIFISGKDWPEGIVGLIAGKLQEKYSRPTVVASIVSKTKEVKGSARSPEYFNITEALSRQAHLLDRFGGHVQAAGFALSQKNLQKFQSAIIVDAEKRIKNEDMISNINISSKLSLGEIDEKLVDTLMMFSPFGPGNPTPHFLFEKIKLIDMQVVGKENKHIKILFGDHDKTIEAMGFNLALEFSKAEIGDVLDLVGRIKYNNWNGRKKIQIDIDDFQISKKN